MKRITKAALCVLLVMLLLPSSTLTFMSFAETNTPSYLGLSGYPTSTNNIGNVIQTMQDNSQNLYRMSFNPEWFTNKPHPYQASYIQYFLDHSDYMIIVDRNHLYPPNEDSASTARQNWETLKSSIFEVLKTWPNNPRVAVELINEYVSNDFYVRMQHLVTEIREAGYTNPIVVNKWNQAWTKISDPLDQTYQGYHFYFNSWSVSGALSQINIALGRGIKIINTEVGASFNEHNDFTTANVGYLSNFLAQCADLGVGNTIWMNENLNNWKTYTTLNLKLPTVTQPTPTPTPTSTPSPTAEPSPTPAPTPTPTPTSTPSPTAEPSPTPAPTPTPTPTLPLYRSNRHYWDYRSRSTRYYPWR
jgi:cell division septation protein DedD